MIAIDGSLLFDRFSPQSIAIVHLFTIGFVAMSIFGALGQMLPVLAGARVPNFYIFSLISFVFLVIGLLAFSSGFYFAASPLKQIAVIFLSIAVLSHLAPIVFAIVKADTAHFTVRGMLISVLFGLLALLLGLHLLSSYAFGTLAPSHQLFANLHIVLAVFGFASILIIAVAHQVLPMFFVAPQFPNFCKKFLFVFSLFLVAYIGLSFANVEVGVIISIVISVFMSAFAVVALKKIKERRRKIADTSLRYWQFGLSSLFIGCVVLLVSKFTNIQNIDFILALFFGFGFLASIMKAMLNKIVPFLVWFHLTSQGNFDAPNINDLLPQKMAKIEFWINLLAFGFFVISNFWPFALQIAGFIYAMSFVVLAYNMRSAASGYKIYRAKK